MPCLTRFPLPTNDLSWADNLSYIEHIFEISRRPDLLTRVVEYRTTVLKISEDDEIDTKLTRIPSAKKYKGRAKGGPCALQISLTRTNLKRKHVDLLLSSWCFCCRPQV